MNKALIYQVLEDPALLHSLPLEELEKISIAYPWFTAVQVLLAKAYQQNNDHRFTDQLHQAALYSPDRRVLYDYIRKEESPERQEIVNVVVSRIAEEIPAQITEKSEVAEAPVSTVTPVTTPVVSPETIFPTDGANAEETTSLESFAGQLIEDESEIAAIRAEVPLIHVPAPESAAPVAEVTPVLPTSQQVIAESEEIPARKVKAADLDDLERQIIVEAVSSTIEQEAEEETEEESGAVEQLTAAGSGVDSETDVIAEGQDSYAAWMMRRARQIHYHDEDKEITGNTVSNGKSPETGPVAAGVKKSDLPDKKQSDTGISHSAIRLRPSDKKTHQQQLIDQFIKLEPKITPGKIAEFTPGNLAKDSLEDDLDLVTETMARLFAAQGKIDKARKAYKKLIEQHPEKSVYFAAQLKNLNTTKKG